jgi:hypothetical protein
MRGRLRERDLRRVPLTRIASTSPRERGEVDLLRCNSRYENLRRAA